MKFHLLSNARERAHESVNGPLNTDLGVLIMEVLRAQLRVLRAIARSIRQVLGLRSSRKDLTPGL